MNRFEWGFLLSGAVHLTAFSLAGGWAMTSPVVEVTSGETQVRIVFQQVKPPEVSMPIAIEPRVAEKKETEKIPEVQREETQLTPSIETEGVEFKEVDYASNPPPVYPRVAVLRNIQGKVVVWVKVSPKGDPLQVKIVQSSGHRILDDAAVEAVWKWRFSPARIGKMPITSQVRIPIQFRIVEEKGHPRKLFSPWI